MKSRSPQGRAFQNGVAMHTTPKLGRVVFRRSFGGTIATMRRLSFGPTLRLALLLVLIVSGSVRAQESTQDLAAGGRAQQSMQDLAVAAQNPIAAMYSLPSQNKLWRGRSAARRDSECAQYSAGSSGATR